MGYRTVSIWPDADWPEPRIWDRPDYPRWHMAVIDLLAWGMAVVILGGLFAIASAFCPARQGSKQANL